MSQPIFNITTPGFTPDIPGSAGGPAFSRPYTTDLTPQDIISISTRSGEPKKNGFAHNLKEYGKGLFNGGWNMITGLLSLKGLAFAVGTAGLVWMTGGTILPLMAVAGLGLGTIQTLKGALSGNWEQAGEGTFTLGASMLGMKGISKTPKWMDPWIQGGKEQTARLSGAVDSATSRVNTLTAKVVSGGRSIINSVNEQAGNLKSTVLGSNSAAKVEGAAGATVKNVAPDLPKATEKPVQEQVNNDASKTAQPLSPNAEGSKPTQPQPDKTPPQAEGDNTLNKEGETTSETTQTNGVDGKDPKASSTKEGETTPSNGADGEEPKAPPPETSKTPPAPTPNAEPPSSQTGNKIQTLTNTPADDNQTKTASGSSNNNWGKCKEQTNQFFKNDMVSGHIYSGTIPNSFSGISNSGTDN